MLIRFGFDIEFELPAPTVVTCMLYTHPCIARSLLEPDEVRASPDLRIKTYWLTVPSRISQATSSPD